MAIKKLNPYLNFNGTAAKAIKLYEKALDAKTENVMPWTKPGRPAAPQPETKDRIMHAVLHIGDGVGHGQRLAARRCPSPPGATCTSRWTSTTRPTWRAEFDALSAGGKITMPLQDTFWGAKFGMVIDAVRRLVDVQLPDDEVLTRRRATPRQLL